MLAMLLREFEAQRAATLADAARVPDARAFEQPAGLVNHAAWTVGHLCASDMLAMVELGRGAVDEGLMALCGPGSTPSADGASWAARFGSMARACDAARGSHARVMAALREETEESLRRPPANERSREWFPSLQHALTYLLWHEGYHAGQLSQWLRAAGLTSPPA